MSLVGVLGLPFAFIVIFSIIPIDLVFFVYPVVIFILLFRALKHFAKGNLRKHIYKAYTVVFVGVNILCAYVFMIFTYMTYCTWDKIDVDGYFNYESQALPTTFVEYDLRLSFDSGKIVNIEMDYSGLSEFGIYKLKNGNILMEGKGDKDWQKSYIVDSKSEEVYLLISGYMYKLNGNILKGYHYPNSDNIMKFPAGDGFEEVKGIDIKTDLDNKEFLGELKLHGFYKD